MSDGERSRLEHPLIGIDRRWSALGGAYCVVVVLATVVASWLYTGGVTSLPRWSLGFVDGFSGALILVAVLSSTLLPPLYGGRNGGPAMAAAIGLTPMLSGSAISFEYTLTNDVVVALIGAAAGAVVAVGVTWRRHSRVRGQLAPDRATVDGLLLASGLSTVALVAVWRFDQGAPPVVVATIDPLQWLVLVPVVACAVLWGVAFTTEAGPFGAYSASR